MTAPGVDAVGEDVALTRAAQSGEVAALGLLLEQHRAGMRAVALSILGPGPDADDAVQDAALTALRGIGDVRDPAAVGAWLRMIVRNRCRDMKRAARQVEPYAVVPRPRSGERAGVGPEDVLDRLAMRDWVWEALEQLSPTLRLPLVLRYFTQGVTGYERIAEVCGVPVGTVRSRLNQGRGKLADALAATTADAHSDARVRTRSSWQEAHNTLAAAEAGDFGKIISRRWSPELSMMTGATRIGDGALIRDAMDVSLAAGVRQRPVNVAAGRSVAVWEMDMINPTDDPEHCPSALAWIMSLDGGRVSQLRLVHPVPLDGPATPDLYALTQKAPSA